MSTDIVQDTPAARDYFGAIPTPVSFEQWLDNVACQLAGQRRRWLVGHHNLHSLHVVHTNPAVAQFYQRCDECYLDGMPLRAILAGMGVRTGAHQRFSLMDRFEDLLSRAQKEDWCLYYLGSEAAVVNAARTLLREHYPGLRIELCEGHQFDDSAVCDAINRLAPDLLLVGMGMPRQEEWLAQHLPTLNVGVALQAGATLDYFAGAQARPPRWISGLGLAWLYRLTHDPARLWRRYLVEPWYLLRPTLQLWRNYRVDARS